MAKEKVAKEEREVVRAFEAGKLKRVKSVEKEKERYRQYARWTLSKPRTISIRLSARDLQRIRALAAERGLPYQTFVSALLHQYSKRKEREFGVV